MGMHPDWTGMTWSFYRGNSRKNKKAAPKMVQLSKSLNKGYGRAGGVVVVPGVVGVVGTVVGLVVGAVGVVGTPRFWSKGL